MRKHWANVATGRWRHEPSGAEVIAVACRGGAGGRLGQRQYEVVHGENAGRRCVSLRDAQGLAEDEAAK